MPPPVDMVGRQYLSCLRTAQDENRKRQRGRNEKGGEGGGSELQRAKEGGRGCAHTHTKRDTKTRLNRDLYV